MIKLYKCYEFDFAKYDEFYLKRCMHPTGRGSETDLYFPNTKGGTLSRIFHNLFIMKLLAANNSGMGKCTLTPVGGHQIIEWDVENEEICVSMDHLVGFSNGIKLKFLIAFVPGAFAAGSIFYTVAYGTGTLLFESRGLPEVFTGSEKMSFDLQRLVAWRKSSQFSFVKSGRLIDCYFSDVTLSPMSNSVGVIDVGTPNSVNKNSILKLLRRIYSPI